MSKEPRPVRHHPGLWAAFSALSPILCRVRRRSFGALDALALIGVVGFSIARFIPVAVLIPFWGCGFRKMTGIPCPGCGLTRVADRFSHFNVLGALKANPLGTIAAALFAGAIVFSAVHLIFGAPVPELVLDQKE